MSRGKNQMNVIGRSNMSGTSDKGTEEDNDFANRWYDIIMDDLNYRMGEIDNVWEKSELMTRNSKSGARRGNLVAEFNSTITSKLMARDLDIKAEAYDPEHAEGAKRFEISANTIASITSLQDLIQDAANNAMWSIGWLQIGHPLDLHSLDVDKLFDTPDATNSLDISTNDEWEAASEDELRSYGINPNEIEAFDTEDPAERKHLEMLRGQQTTDSSVKQEKIPVSKFPSDVAIPYITSVNPKLVIHSREAKSLADMDYIGRIYFLSRKELQIILRRDIPEGMGGLTGRMRGLFESVTGYDAKRFPTMMAVMRVWVRRDREEPKYNWHQYLMLPENRGVYFGLRPNSAGRFIPMEPVKLQRQKAMFDKPLASEIAHYANLYDLFIQAIERGGLRLLHDKWWANNGANLGKKERAKLLNDTFRGIIDVTDQNAINRVEEGIDNGLFQAAMFFKSAAQAQAGQSDLDRGTAVKGITARQTEALLDATGINMKAMSLEIGKAAAKCVIKLMYMLTKFVDAGEAGSDVWGKDAISFDRSTQDVNTSMLYKLKVVDHSDDPSQEDRLLLLQLIRALGPQVAQQVSSKISIDFLARELLYAFGYGGEGLASRGGEAGMMPPENAGPMGVPGQPGSGSPSPLASAPAHGLPYGQHPERLAGETRDGASQPSVDLGNLMRGGMATGTGQGE